MSDFETELRHDGAVQDSETSQYVESLKRSVLAAYGHGISEDECLSWLEADLTVDQAVGWMNHGCGPGDAAGCWTQDPDEAFAGGDDDGEDE